MKINKFVVLTSSDLGISVEKNKKLYTGWCNAGEAALIFKVI